MPPRALAYHCPTPDNVLHSFRECLRRRHLQPADGILFCFVEAQQAAIQFCERTRVDNMFHGLLLAAVTE